MLSDGVIDGTHDRIDAEVEKRIMNRSGCDERALSRMRLKEFQRAHIAKQEMHRRAATDFVTHYRFVALGKTNVKSCIRNATSHLQSFVKRNLLGLGHCAFRERLLHRAKDTDCHVHLQDESWTSATCGECGNTDNVKRNRVCVCDLCGYATDRDVNGARNILRKAINYFYSFH